LSRIEFHRRGREKNYREVTEIRDGICIDWDAPTAMDDGVVLRAGVFGGDVTLRSGPDRQAHLLLPVIPPR